MPLDLEELVDAAFDSRGDELAYLAITANSEIALRDRLAVYLHFAPSTADRGWVIAREARPRRIDLAVLDNAQVRIAAVEFKAAYSYDVFKHRKWEELRAKIGQDVGKLSSINDSPNCEKVVVLFVAHPTQEIPDKLETVAGKYRTDINAFIRRVRSEQIDVADGLLEALRSGFPGVHLISDQLSGTCFGIQVEFFWYAIPVS